jgi:SulP family sulfate permease
MSNPTVDKYFKTNFIPDLKAGFITAIVALPLAIAFAIASGVNPIMGMYTAIIAGILAAIFGGSTFSITGPTGAMTVIVLSTVQKFGIEGLLLAGFLSGIILLLFSYLKLGIVLKYIPFPVISGFTAGIGIIIFLGQVPNFLGITLATQGTTLENLMSTFSQISLINLFALIIGILTILCMVFLPKLLSKTNYIKNIPASIIALLLSVTIVILGVTVPTVGKMSASFPLPSLFNINLSLVIHVLPAALTIALLGAIESLLCAAVCDSITSTKHNSNKELFGQGIANLIVPFFGGIPATAAIARSAVNIKEGAKTKMAAIYQSLILLLILLFFGSYTDLIPKAFLAGILMVVSFRMVNIAEAKTIFRLGRLEVMVYLTTLILTVITDLVFAIQVGMVLAMLLLFVKLVKITDIKNLENSEEDTHYKKEIDKDKRLKDKVQIYTIYGPLFFGVINVFETKIDEHLQNHSQIIILRFKFVPFIDSTGLERLKIFIKDRQKRLKSTVILTSLSPQVKKTFEEDHEISELISKKQIFKTTEEAIEYIKKELI